MAKKDTDGKTIGIENLKGFTRGAHVGKLTFIPTGHPQLDYALASGVLQDKDADNEPMGSGGLPLGKMVEVYGEEGSGKSSLAYRVVGNAQRMGFVCAWIDAEHSYSKQLADINGVDTDELVYTDLTNVEDPSKVDDAETVIDKIIQVCESGIKVVVVDSVAHLIPRAVMENPADKQTIGMLARLLAAQLPKINNYAAAHDVLIIFINQLREKIGVMYGDPEGSPGGRALRHNCSIRLKISKAMGKSAAITIENDEGEDEVIGGTAYVMVKKNRFAAPIRESIQIPIYYRFYFPNFAEHLFNAGRQLNVIRVIKGVYNYNGMKVEGRDAFIKAIQDNAKVDDIVKDVVSKAEEKQVPLPAEIMTYLHANQDQKTAVEDENKKKGKKPKKSSDADTVAVSDDANL